MLNLTLIGIVKQNKNYLIDFIQNFTILSILFLGHHMPNFSFVGAFLQTQQHLKKKRFDGRNFENVFLKARSTEVDEVFLFNILNIII